MGSKEIKLHKHELAELPLSSKLGAERSSSKDSKAALTENGNLPCAENANAKSKPTSSSSLTKSAGNHSKIKKLFGKPLFLLTITIIAFLGIFVYLIQLVLAVTINLSDNSKWRRSIKRINSELFHTLYSPVTFLVYYWANAHLKMEIEDFLAIHASNKPYIGIVLPNHTYELDYLTIFLQADQIGNYGIFKCMIKDELKHIPILGWCLRLDDNIFLKRNWNKDKLSIGKQLDRIFDYGSSVINIFAEGTRWTPEKHEISNEFAKTRGLKPLKYHLSPRTRGFIYTFRHLLLDKRTQEKQFGVFNIQNVMVNRISFKDFIEGRQYEVDSYFEEVVVSEEICNEVLQSKSEEDCPKLTQLLREVFERKDKLMDEYKANGNMFPSKRGANDRFKKPILPLIIWVAGFCLTYGTIGYLAMFKFATSITFWSLIIGYMSSCIWLLEKVIRESSVLPNQNLLQPSNSDKHC